MHCRLNGIFERLILYLCGGRNSEEIREKARKNVKDCPFCLSPFPQDAKANVFAFSSRTEHQPDKGLFKTQNNKALSLYIRLTMKNLIGPENSINSQ